jgi:CRISPR-associated endoribonuclease Cas6
MRIKVTVQKASSNPIHYDYQYGLASMLYRRLATADVELANETHSHGGFKFYTFSNIVTEDRLPASNGLNFTKGHFLISSPDPKFIKSFAKGLLAEPEFILGKGDLKADFLMEQIEVMDKPHLPDECIFRTLSPIYIKTTRKNQGQIVEVDLYPKDAKFYENLHRNLVARYEEYHGHKVEHDHFDVISVDNVKPKRISVGSDKRRCSLMTMTLQASPELLSFAYDAGLGEKNAMGFGCVEATSTPIQ